VILAMHMRVARRFVIPELADHTQEIELWASTVPEWATSCESDECIDPKVSGPVVLHLHTSGGIATIAACVVLDLRRGQATASRDLAIGNRSFVIRERNLAVRHSTLSSRVDRSDRWTPHCANCADLTLQLRI